MAKIIDADNIIMRQMKNMNKYIALNQDKNAMTHSLFFWRRAQISNKARSVKKQVGWNQAGLVQENFLKNEFFIEHIAILKSEKWRRYMAESLGGTIKDK